VITDEEISLLAHRSGGGVFVAEAVDKNGRLLLSVSL
jgi:hypothetical protein